MTETKTKTAIKSGTIWGAGLSALAGIGALSQHYQWFEFASLVKPEIYALISTVGSIIAIFRRTKAEKKIAGIF